MSVSQETLAAYDATRDFSDKRVRSVCYAPFISLYFDQLGFVRVCCQNTMHTVGNIAEQSLDEIWHGEKIKSLRRALMDYDFKLGCRFCEWQLKDGDFATSFMRTFDEFPVNEVDPDWPVRMEFSVSNTCNLECIMCNGEWSSSIRSRREQLAPLPKPYGDRFFDQLRKYLPHLKAAKFLGGEPFLAQESLRIWNMMVEDNLGHIQCHVTTNGTQYNAKVQRILDVLPVSFSISMDGVTKETVESVRVNARHEALLDNFQRFHAYARARGTYIGLTFCLMQKNWHEFGEYLLFADRWGCPVAINTVIQPLSLSLHVLPKEELAEVVRQMDAQDAELRPKLTLNRQVWVDQLERLRHRLGTKIENLYFVPLKLTDNFTTPPASTRPVMTERSARERLARWDRGIQPEGYLSDAGRTITGILGEATSILGIPADRVLGKPVDQLPVEVMKKYGERMEILSQEDPPGYVDRLVSLKSPGRPTNYLRSISFPRTDEFGQPAGTVTLVALATRLPSARTRVCDTFKDAKGDSREGLSEPMARRLLVRWAGGKPVDSFDTDWYDDVLPETVAAQGFLGIPPEEVAGRGFDEIYQALLNRHGEDVELVRGDRSNEHDDCTIAFRSGQQVTYVRLVVFPRLNAEGSVIGCRVLGAITAELAPLGPKMTDQFEDHDGVAAPVMTESMAKNRLAQWGQDSQIDSIICDAWDRVEDLSSPARGLGLSRDSIRGRSINEVFAELRRRYGEEVRNLKEEAGPEFIDRLVAFSSPNQPPTYVRAITIPRYGETGLVTGTVTLAAATTRLPPGP